MQSILGINLSLTSHWSLLKYNLLKYNLLKYILVKRNLAKETGLCLSEEKKS